MPCFILLFDSKDDHNLKNIYRYICSSKKNVIKQLILASQLKGNCPIDFYTFKVSLQTEKTLASPFRLLYLLYDLLICIHLYIRYMICCIYS